MTVRIDGKAVAARVRTDVADQVADLPDQPGLATVLVGDDPASAVYVAGKRRAVVAAGMRDVHRALPADVTQDRVAQVLDELAADPAVSGILLQLPLPAGLDAPALLDRIPPGKDVDGLTTVSAGLLARGEPGLRPCTPSGVLGLLDDAGVALRGVHAVVVGRSALVGRPMGHLLLQRDASVTIVHRHSLHVPAITREADVLVVAAGVPGLIGRADVKEGAAVVDVGIHRTPAGLTGDVRTEELQGHAGWVTPVPGGVGPMTIAMLLSNTLDAARTAARR